MAIDLSAGDSRRLDTLTALLAAEFPGDKLRIEQSFADHRHVYCHRWHGGERHSFFLHEDEFVLRRPEQLYDFVAGALMGDVWPS